MKQLKRTLLIILFICMTNLEMSAYHSKINGICYNFYNSEAIVTYGSRGYSNEYVYSGDIVIPESVIYNGQTYSVTSIDDGTFRYCYKITSVTIPNSITSIGSYSFEDCGGMTSVVIPNSVTSIGIDAFKNCSSLSSLVLSDNLVSISRGMFQNCSMLSSVLIPNSVISIEDHAFEGCRNLCNVIIPSGVTTIGEGSFYNCNLESFTIGSGVKKIKRYVFNNMPTKVFWLTNTPPVGFENAEGIINYVLNDQFANDCCNKFVKCEYIMIYPYLSSIFEYEGIRYVPIDPIEKTCDAIDCVYDNNTANLIVGNTPVYKGVEMTIKNYNPYFCSGNSNINTIKWKTNAPVPSFAFQRCQSLQILEIDDNTAVIENGAFARCEELQNVRIGRGVLAIDDNAFMNCISLHHISIPSNVIRVCDYAFKGCSSLKNVNFEELNKTSDVHRLSFENTIFNSKLHRKTYDFDVSAGDVLYFDYSHEIGQGSRGIFRIYINGSLERELTSSESSYFIYKFDKPQSVELVISLYPGVWDNNTAYVYNMEVGNDFSLSLGSNGNKPLFVDCPLDTILIGRNLHYSSSEKNGFSPFYGNNYLKSVYITENETDIFDYEFSNCSSLNDINIGDNIKSIGIKSFSGCRSLERFICGSKVNSIGQESFSGCSEIKRFVCYAITPPICGYQALTDINKWNCTLSVPPQSMSAYQQADQWKDFFFIDNDLTSINKQSNNIISPTHFFDINGRTNKKTNTGLNIILMNNGSIRKVLVR